MGYGAAGIRLKGQFRYLPGTAELAKLFERVVVGTAERAIEAMLAFEHRSGTAKTLPRQHGRDHSAVRRPARVQTFSPGAVSQIFDDARALTAAQSQGIAPLHRLETIEFAGRSSSTEGGAKSRRMKAPRVKLTRCHEADFAHHFRPGDGRF